jgi:predicted DNA-binding transcriptional regulator YafY
VATASVVFDEEVAWIAERELGPNMAIERRSDGSISATVEIAEPAAFLGWLVGFEDQAEIVEPPDLRDRYLSLVGGS